MAAPTYFDAFFNDLLKGVHDFSSDTFKVMLTNTTPVAASDAVKTDITEITAGNGYTAGGNDATVTLSGATVSATDITITASADSIGPFRYAVLYNSTAADGNLVCYWDKGSAITLAADEAVKLDFDTTENELFTLAAA